MASLHLSAKEKHTVLIDEMRMSRDEAAHFLVDAGEITQDEHKDLLSVQERKRVYPYRDHAEEIADFNRRFEAGEFERD